MPTRLLAKGLLLATAALLLSGCQAAAPTDPNEGTQMPELSDEAVYAEGKQRFADFRAEVAAVQLGLHDGTWQVDRYGAVPIAAECVGAAPGYSFDLGRSVVSLDFDVEQAPDALIEQLLAKGWGGAGVTAEERATPGQASRVVTASDSPEGNVRQLIVSFYEGNGSISVKAESACFPGDEARLYDLVIPDKSSLIVPIYPASEHPNDAPLFRFSLADGTARDELAEAQQGASDSASAG